MKWRFSIILLGILVSFQCSDDDLQFPDCDKIACSDEFVIITVHITDSSGANIPLSDFEVRDADTGEDLRREFTEEEFETFRQAGLYPLYGDENFEESSEARKNIIFTGSINGEVVVEEEYTVGADCCHVRLISGDDTLILGETD